MFCVECGQKLPDDAKFCFGCGKPQNRTDGNTAEQVDQTVGDKPKTEESSESSIVLPDVIEDTIEVEFAAISPNGKYLAMKVDDELQIMDTPSGKIVHSVDWKEEWNVNYFGIIHAVSTDGNYVILYLGGNISLYNAKTGMTTDIDDGSYPAVLSADNKLLAYCTDQNDKAIKIINVQKGNELFRIKKGDYVDAIAFSPDNRYLLTNASYIDETILWDVKSGTKLYDFDTVKKINHITFSNDGERIAIATNGDMKLTGSDTIIGIRDTKSGNLYLQFVGAHREFFTDGGISFISFSPNDKVIVGCHNRPPDHECKFKIFNAETGELLKEVVNDRNITWATYSSDGKKIITYSEGRSEIGFIKILVSE
jgi:WD40 repeat protein